MRCYGGVQVVVSSTIFLRPKGAYMQKLNPEQLTAKQVHKSLKASGFIPLVGIGNSMTYTRENRLVRVRYDANPTGTSIDYLNVTGADYVTFTLLKSGEVLANV
jgi:hypothetical protein